MAQLVTREGNLFQVADQRGDLTPEGGLFKGDTRFLSRFELRCGGELPTLLSSTTAENYRLHAFLMSGVQDPFFYQSKLAIQRQRVLHDDVLYERVEIENPGLHEVQVRLDLQFASDFIDLFELRGVQRQRRGERLDPAVAQDRVRLGYLGLDGVRRETALLFLSPPTALSAESASWELVLAPKEARRIDVIVMPAEDGAFGQPTSFDAAAAALQASYGEWRDGWDSDNVHLNRVLERSLLDLRLLRAEIGHGPFLVAGIPWFAVPFGRDSLIAALLALPVAPELALGTLRTMAALQGQADQPDRLEAPGKIPHELRSGEMANLGEVPFGRYYGSVDATPLFLLLVAEYYAWTADLDSVRRLLPNIKAALTWCGEGWLTFQADTGLGLAVQSWKDSRDSLSHRDGQIATGAIAVSEVQGYIYDAKRRLVPLMEALGESELAGRLRLEALTLKERFNEAFWMADRQFYAIALDGEGRQVGTLSSDIGHCLWSGIVAEERASAVSATLLSPELFSGWGIRTLASTEATYNPISYHNGSVWPHDTALALLGLKRYGFDEAVCTVATGLIDAALHFPECRLPELFCGYGRSGSPHGDQGRPVEYPVACSPQAWAAVAPFGVVRTLLGLEPDAANGILRLRPVLPPWLGRLNLRGLQVGSARVDLTVTQEGVTAVVTEGDLWVVVEARA